jgi:hypothetical protein
MVKYRFDKAALAVRFLPGSLTKVYVVAIAYLVVHSTVTRVGWVQIPLVTLINLVKTKQSKFSRKLAVNWRSTEPLS